MVSHEQERVARGIEITVEVFKNVLEKEKTGLQDLLQLPGYLNGFLVVLEASDLSLRNMLEVYEAVRTKIADGLTKLITYRQKLISEAPQDVQGNPNDLLAWIEVSFGPYVLVHSFLLAQYEMTSRRCELLRSQLESRKSRQPDRAD